VSGNEDGGTPENFEVVDMGDVGPSLDADESAASHVFQSVDHVVPDSEEQLIDFDEEMELDEQPASSEQQQYEPPADDDFDLPSPPPPLEQEDDDQ